MTSLTLSVAFRKEKQEIIHFEIIRTVTFQLNDPNGIVGRVLAFPIRSNVLHSQAISGKRKLPSSLSSMQMYHTDTAHLSVQQMHQYKSTTLIH